MSLSYTLRLFRQDDPFRPIDTRELASGELDIGRDPAAGWRLDDPDRALSRRHLVLAAEGGKLVLRDTSINGVYIGPERRRAPAETAIELGHGEAFRFGPYMIAVEHSEGMPTLARPTRAAPAAMSFMPAPEAPGGLPGSLYDSQIDEAFDAPFSAPILQAPKIGPEVLSPPPAWNRRSLAEGTLLESFCAGAGLDPSAFLDEDPPEVMRRAGAAYQRMVLGLTELMQERAAVKSVYRLDRTTVRAAGNNPFRWASPERVAVDLLRTRDDGFLTDAAAVDGAFCDLKKHLLGVMAGLRGAVAAALETLNPQRIVDLLAERPAKLLKSRSAAAWDTYGEAFETLEREAQDSADSAISRGFRAGYEREVEALDKLRSPA